MGGEPSKGEKVEVWVWGSCFGVSNCCWWGCWGKGVLRLMGSLEAEGLRDWGWGRSGVESMASFFWG